MSPATYRVAPPVASTVIRLEALDQSKVLVLLLLCGGAFVAMTVGVFAAAFAPPEVRPLVYLGAVGVFFVGIAVAVVVMRPRLKRLDFLLELVDDGTGRIRLLAPNGALVAETMNQSLRIARINYTRRGRHGSAWLRPGYRVWHPGGTFLVGTLYPQLSWDGVGHNPTSPTFELGIPEHEAIGARVRS